jgi:periplasmic protein TonB
MIEDEDDFSAESAPRTKLGATVLVVVLHVVAILAIIRAFAPDFTNQVAETVLRTITVTVTTPPPSPEPTKEPEPAGKSGEEGKKAVPREVRAVKPKVDVTKKAEPAPKATSSGSADTSGVTNSGSGTGAGGPGSGTGSGAGGSGTGGGGSALVKTAGEINAARDFPKKTRDLRAGHAVTVEMTVGPDGRASACRVVKPSPDAEADRIVCALAEKRFRFRPKTDGAGNPVAAKYRWQQRWWNPRDGSGED